MLGTFMWIWDRGWLHGQKGQNETWWHLQHHPKALENPSFWVFCFVPCSSLSSCSNFNGFNVPFFRVPPGSFWKHPLSSPLYYSFYLISKQPPPRPGCLMAWHAPKSFRLWSDASYCLHDAPRCHLVSCQPERHGGPSTTHLFSVPSAIWQSILAKSSHPHHKSSSPIFSYSRPYPLLNTVGKSHILRLNQPQRFTLFQLESRWFFLLNS